ncbi:hypothetical protein GOV07_01070 [Candidatus Woesearchaeota archaeon]|nr:hypothetical protein [Candidatus Woesearchaeota archaeon]
MDSHEEEENVLHGFRRLWLEKYDILTLLLSVYGFFVLDKPHSIIIVLLVFGKVFGHKLELDRIISYFWYDVLLLMYPVFLGHYWLGIFFFLTGRARKLDYGITPKEERHPVFWLRNNLGRQK